MKCLPLGETVSPEPLSLGPCTCSPEATNFGHPSESQLPHFRELSRSGELGLKNLTCTWVMCQHTDLRLLCCIWSWNFVKSALVQPINTSWPPSLLCSHLSRSTSWHSSFQRPRAQGFPCQMTDEIYVFLLLALPLGITPGPSISSSFRRHFARQLTILALFTHVILPTPQQLGRIWGNKANFSHVI